MARGSTMVLHDGTGAGVGLPTEVHGDYTGARWVLDACLDSAPFGDKNAWTHPPASGVVEDGHPALSARPLNGYAVVGMIVSNPEDIRIDPKVPGVFQGRSRRYSRVHGESGGLNAHAQVPTCGGTVTVDNALGLPALSGVSEALIHR